MPEIRFRLNGVETRIDADPQASLLSTLRGRLGMTGAHFGCGANESSYNRHRAALEKRTEPRPTALGGQVHAGVGGAVARIGLN